ncbi:MAG: periplasmic heavy metal sensor [Acidobacteriota bacterium]
MRRWGLSILLLLSLGLNLGLIASRVIQRSTSDAASEAAGTEKPETGTSEPELSSASEASKRWQDSRLPRMVQRMANELGLEGEKREAFIEVQRNFFEQTIAARRRMAEVQLEVRREILSSEPDRRELDALLNELSAAHTHLERAFVNNLLDSRQLLDPEQERRFMRFMRRMRQVRSDIERRFRERRGALDRPGDSRQPRRPFLERQRQRREEAAASREQSGRPDS